MTSAHDLRKVLRRFKQQRVVVYGDLVADEFSYGRSNRISREAPVLILEHISSEIRPGGGANSLSNLADLGARAVAVGIVGDDENGRKVLSELDKRGVDLAGVITIPGYHTQTKTRILAGGPHTVSQQVVRIDRGESPPGDSALFMEISRRLSAAAEGSDGLLIADYGSGIIQPDIAAPIVSRIRAAEGVVTIDSRHALSDFGGSTAATPNQEEAEELLGEHLSDVPGTLSRQGQILRERFATDAVVLTMGSRGMALFQKDREMETVPIFGTDEVADVTGAGDTVISTLTLGLLSGADLSGAAQLASIAAGLVVMKRGTATVTVSEIDRGLETWQPLQTQNLGRRNTRD